MGLAKAHGVKSIAFPAISCGVYHFPAALAAGIAISTINQCLQQPHSVESIYLVCFGDAILNAYNEAQQN